MLYDVYSKCKSSTINNSFLILLEQLHIIILFKMYLIYLLIFLKWEHYFWLWRKTLGDGLRVILLC